MSGAWGELSGLSVAGVAARDGAVTAVIREARGLVSTPGKVGFSVARWSPSGTRDTAYGMKTGELLGNIWPEHLAVMPDAAYVTGWSEAPFTSLTPDGECLIGVPDENGHKPSFLAALDPLGKCKWIWSVDAEFNTSPLALAATPKRVVFAVSLSGQATASSRECALGPGDERGSTALVGLDPDGACVWHRTFETAAAVRIEELVAVPETGEVLVFGEYDAPDAAIKIQTMELPRTPDRDLFVARVRMEDGELTDLLPLRAPGSQSAARHGAALLPGGDLVISGTYSGPSFKFQDDCPLLPDAGSSENTFVARVSRDRVLWSRGFGDAVKDQMVVHLEADESGTIYVAGTLEGEIPLESGETIAAGTEELSSYLIALNPSGNVLWGTAIAGKGTVAHRGCLVGRAGREARRSAPHRRRADGHVPSHGLRPFHPGAGRGVHRSAAGHAVTAALGIERAPAEQPTTFPHGAAEPATEAARRGA
ncbi:hypothetical protein BE18_36125 [Sorangium cellulosum]|uniref:Uncharacterized protein n=1 Tax=Sorangium cellulosum TaxID=56 RepID=A0A150RV01_SORCE|nr:hypothetical protein BE18_36125 [Sorangium cellulosum]